MEMIDDIFWTTPDKFLILKTPETRKKAWFVINSVNDRIKKESIKTINFTKIIICLENVHLANNTYAVAVTGSESTSVLFCLYLLANMELVAAKPSSVQ